jgi:hypothetical protein
MSKTEHLLTAALTPRGVMVAAAAIKPGITSLSAFPQRAKPRRATPTTMIRPPSTAFCLSLRLAFSRVPHSWTRQHLPGLIVRDSVAPLVRRLGEPTFVEATGSTPPFAGYSGGGVAAIARCYRVVAP